MIGRRQLQRRVRRALGTSAIAVHWSSCDCDGCKLFVAVESILDESLAPSTRKRRGLVRR